MLNEKIVCALCNKEITDVRSMHTSDIADGMFFCSGECVTEYEEDNYQCGLYCSNCHNTDVLGLFNTDSAKDFTVEDDCEGEEICYTCDICGTVGIRATILEK